jgi:hypothetical protein
MPRKSSRNLSSSSSYFLPLLVLNGGKKTREIESADQYLWVCVTSGTIHFPETNIQPKISSRSLQTNLNYLSNTNTAISLSWLFLQFHRQ